MRKSEIYGSGNWIKADKGTLNIPGNPKSVTVTISKHMEISTFQDKRTGQEKNQRTIYFEELGGEDGPGLSLNNTNWSMIAELTGKDDDEDWPGCQVELYATKVQFGADIVDAVRIRERSVEAKPATSTPEPQLGEAIAKKALDKLEAMDKTEDDLRAFLLEGGNYVPQGPVATWPKSLADKFKAAFEAKCDLNQATNDIPF